MQLWKAASKAIPGSAILMIALTGCGHNGAEFEDSREMLDYLQDEFPEYCPDPSFSEDSDSQRGSFEYFECSLSNDDANKLQGTVYHEDWGLQDDYAEKDSVPRQSIVGENWLLELTVNGDISAAGEERGNEQIEELQEKLGGEAYLK